MRDKIVVIRYAEAFLSYARGTIGLSKAFLELKSARGIFNDNPELAEFFIASGVGFQEKCEMVDKIFKDDFSIETRHFLKLLLDKRRIDKFTDIVEYIRIKYSYGQEEEAILRTSYPLDLELIKRIQDRLENKFKKKFKFFIDCDAQLLGGIQVIIGNTIIDGSVRKQLSDLRQKLLMTG